MSRSRSRSASCHRSISSLSSGALHARFVEAGLPAPRMVMSSRVEGRADSAAFDGMADVVRSLLPAMERFGIARADEVQIDSLAQRVRDEVLGVGGVLVYPPLVGAWSRRDLR